MTRTNTEIIERIKAIESESMGDMFGKRRSVLVVALSFEDAKPWLTDKAIEDGEASWDESRGEVAAEAASYLEFAIGKMQDERGLSANRSVDAFQEYVWLLTDDKTAAEYEATNYGWYGNGQLRFAAKALGLTEIWNRLTDENVPA